MAKTWELPQKCLALFSLAVTPRFTGALVMVTEEFKNSASSAITQSF